MNELDQFAKHKLNVRYYIRYADDFLILSEDRKVLQELEITISNFLSKSLKLELHPKKIILRKLSWGVDFLGYIILPYYSLPRTKTKRRLTRKLKEKINSDSFSQSLASYLGYLSHASAYKFSETLKNNLWIMT